MELQAILDAIGKNPSLIDGLMEPILTSDKGKAAIENRVKAGISEGIGEEIRKTYTGIDDDAFAILGQRPAVKDGKMQKTHEFLKEKLTELKGLIDQKDSLTKDAEVQKLTAEIETLKKSGGGEMIKTMFDAAKQEWATKEADYLKQIETAGKQGTEFQIKTAIASARSGLNFNPDLDESIRNIVLESAESALLAGAKMEGDKLTFFKPDGKPYLNATTYEPMTANEVLASMESVQKIIKKDGQQGGGSAPQLDGSLTTVKVDGKDTKKLDIKGTFKTQTEFTETAEKLLRESGVVKTDPEYFRLKDEAFNELNVASLPLQ